MTDGDQLMIEEGEAFLSQTLRESGPRKLLNALDLVPLCAICPAAQWYQTEAKSGDAQLACFCTAFRGVMYDNGRNAVRYCDGREDAIKALNAPAQDSA